MANQNFRVKTGLEVGTGVTISAGVVTTVNLSSQQINISGVSTFAGITTVTGVSLFAKQLSVSGVSTFQSDIKLGDSDSVYFGDNNNLRIFNDGSNSYISDQGIGNLVLLGDSEVWIGNTAASEYKARFITDGAVELYYENVKKFETTGYGATVFGTLQSQGLQVFGDSYISGNLGVGITNPGTKLDVFGDIRLSNIDAEIEFNAGGARLKGLPNALSIHSGGGLNSSVEEQLRINSTGVGIGTTVPISKLHVVGSGTTALLVEGNARITGILTVGTSSVTFDGTNNSITVGTGVTIFGNTGIVSATEFRGNGSNLTGVQPFPSGTLMLFQQTAAPTGWTKQTTHNNKTLRVVSGAAGSGGSTAFTSVFASRTPSGSVTMSNAAVTLSESQIPSHTHTFTVTEADDNNHSGNGNNSAANADAGINGSVTTAGTGGGSSHTHNNTASFTGTAMDFDIQYVDLIIASKN